MIVTKRGVAGVALVVVVVGKAVDVDMTVAEVWKAETVVGVVIVVGVEVTLVTAVADDVIAS